ncbi:PIR Superfamily Protein [Plasmodium ovale wallikeri]|uniref:PIR Superfamily Protein n=1 Tax=Plasmodium ovale wallikeri TaxID=864142 RepID=A0A1A8ZKT9_PLAOA|nr:PIR Superfamily Protein [Plasmodium ovale wallikeri]SBT44444.1 PIR Superfamily Protein [Plasmodium ovale wallikeri]
MNSAASDIYSFFDNYKIYKSYEREMEEKISGGKGNTTCDSFSTDVQISDTESAKNICVKFKFLHNFIISIKKPTENKSLNDTDFAFLNYWLNNKLRNTRVNHNFTVEEFRNDMSDHEVEFIYNDFDRNIYHIKDEDINNMNLLSELHTNYGEIFPNYSTIMSGNVPCIEYLQKCINTYRKCIIKCPDARTSFCKALNHFKVEYEKTFFGEFGISEKCPDKEFLKLPTYNDILQENQKITVFTPLGQWIRTKMGSNEGVRGHIYEENEQLLLDTSDTERIISDYNEYGISYDSAVNT